MKAGVEEAEEAVACQDILVVQTEEVVAVAVAVGGVVVGEGAPCRDVKVVRVACAVEAVLACWVQQPQQVQTFSVNINKEAVKSVYGVKKCVPAKNKKNKKK